MKITMIKQTILILIIILISAILIINYPYKKHLLTKSITQNEGEYVVLLHGLIRTSYSMQKLGINLANEGYKVININYPTRQDTIENLVENNIKPELQKYYTDKNLKINFVTHSMGGIMVRYLLENNEYKNLGKVIMLAPPNKGSEKADKWIPNKIVNYIMGPALKQLSTDKNSLANTIPTPKYTVGIIAGKNDQTVAIKRTKLENTKDSILVKTGHSFIMYNQEVINHVIHFLQNGEF